MRKIILYCVFVITSIAASSQNNAYFEGAIEVNFTKMPLTIEYTLLDKDTLKLYFGSPSQTNDLLKATKAYFKGDSLLFQLKKNNIVYRGKFNEAKDTINGVFKQGLLKTPLMFVKRDTAFAYVRPQTPLPPFAYVVKEVEFVNPKLPKYTFKGTLTMPKRGRNFLCVVLLSGSGVQNRDEEIYGHKPFLVIADHLAKCGIATFRYDDRGYGTNDKKLLDATTMDYVADAQAAIAAVKAEDKIDTNHISLLGHSEGALIAEIIAAKDSSINCLVLLGAPAVDGRSLLVSQLKAISQADSISNDSISVMLEQQTKSLNDPKLPKWLKTYIAIDPKEYLQDITQPALFLYGKKDLQVVPSDNIPVIKQYFGKKKGNNSYKILEMPEDNHLFQRCETGLPSEYGDIEMTLDNEVLYHIVTFIREKGSIKRLH
ncbi:MAG: lysophospholipase [Bacteroidales bacterium]|jgi:pimeloyl-ACP methyl ester carboxylesterase|nr:lysophospholipase [Bacteroidales bacterium]